MKGVYHRIAADLDPYALWLIWDWSLFGLWLEIWATKHEA